MLCQTLHLSQKGQSDSSNDNKENEPVGNAVASVYIEMGKGAAHVILHLDYFVDHSITLPGQIQLDLVDSFLHNPTSQHRKIMSLFEIAMSCNKMQTSLTESTKSVGHSNTKEIKDEQLEANVPLGQYLQVKKQLDDLHLKVSQMAAKNSQLRDLLSQGDPVKLEHPLPNGGPLSSTFGLDTLMPAKNKSALGPKKTKKDMDVINPRRKKQRTAGGFKFGQ